MLFIIIAATAASLLEYRSLYRIKQYREIAVSAVLLVLGLALGILQLLHISVATPLNVIVYLFKPISDALNQLLS